MTARRLRIERPVAVAGWLLCLSLAGCTSLHDYVQNGFKVGPSPAKPPAPMAELLDRRPAASRGAEPELVEHWWTVFHDPKLDQLIACAYRQNLTLSEAYYRVIEARAQRAIAVGEMFPQQQYMQGSYSGMGGCYPEYGALPTASSISGTTGSP